MACYYRGWSQSIGLRECLGSLQNGCTCTVPFFNVIEAELDLRKFLVRKEFKRTSGWLLTSCHRFFPESPAGTLWKESFANHGFYTWDVTVARKKIKAKITPEDLQNFMDWDTSFVWDKFPETIDVLSLHGLSDNTVPPFVSVS